MKTYQVADLFYTAWKQLEPKAHAEVFGLKTLIKQMKPSQKEYGFTMIAILRMLRRNLRLVDKINEAQAVDIFNDMTFLDEPWYHFPIKSIVCGDTELIAPHEHMARHTFDHFIYADNEFSRSLINGTDRPLQLRRLVATLYTHALDEYFDREVVEDRALALKIKDWELQLIAATYAHIRTFITSRCKHLMPPLPKGSEPQEPTVTGPMWQELKHRLSETPAFQGFDKAGRANVYDCLDYLDDLAKQKTRNVKA